MSDKLNTMISNKKKLEHSKKCYNLLYPEFKQKEENQKKKKEIFEVNKKVKKININKKKNKKK